MILLKTFKLAAVAFFGLGGLSSALAFQDPVALYGPQAFYDVFRNGEPVGEHRMEYQWLPPLEGRQQKRLQVSSALDLDITFLGLTVYTYRYRSDALWEQDRGLTSISSQVRENSEETAANSGFLEQDGTFVFEGGNGRGSSSGTIYPTNHWNVAVLNQSEVFNTLTGSINAVEILKEDQEPLPVNGQDVLSTRYRYTGELRTEVWYDDRGRWVGLRFEGSDGSEIVYRCRLCAPTGQEQ
ncbi:DUF6134 family protein [Kiloniella sp. b19]|uniref:DUF6134 family protein n=1 Tax=Kiloniella sp. GXU_MW_B19 TaxID=3141326 RepID=UPI0031D3030A